MRILLIHYSLFTTGDVSNKGFQIVQGSQMRAVLNRFVCYPYHDYLINILYSLSHFTRIFFYIREVHLHIFILKLICIFI